MPMKFCLYPPIPEEDDAEKEPFHFYKIFQVCKPGEPAPVIDEDKKIVFTGPKNGDEIKTVPQANGCVLAWKLEPKRKPTEKKEKRLFEKRKAAKSDNHLHQ